MTDSHAPDPAPVRTLPRFRPVPVTRTRHDGWTPERQRGFIAALATSGVVAQAAKAVGMGVTSAYRLRKQPGATGFARAWDRVVTAAHDRALAFVIDRALNGTIRPRFYRGRCVGHAHVYETKLALAALRAADATDRAK